MFKIVNAAINPWGTLLGIPRETNMPPPNIPWAPLGEACPLNVLTVVNEILAITCCREDEGTENEVRFDLLFSVNALLMIWARGRYVYVGFLGLLWNDRSSMSLDSSSDVEGDICFGEMNQ